MNYKVKLVILVLVIGGGFLVNKMSWQGDDLAILSINSDKVEMVNISPSRGMVNSYEIQNMDLWIPNGMGWYPVSRLSLIVKDDEELARKVFFYNFGFWPQVVLRDKSWKDNLSLWKMLGPVGWLRFRLLTDQWLWKKDVLKIDNLVEVMPRDMAQTKILEADIRINVVNASGKNGLGNMIADRLEWWGLMVTSVQTREVEDKCRIYFDFKNKNKEIMSFLAKILNCEKIDRSGQVELVLGQEYEEMIKYSQTYVRSF